MPTDGFATAYGSATITEKVHKWLIKIMVLHRDEEKYLVAPYIGIIEDKEEYLRESQNDDKWEDHGYQLCGGRNSGYTYSQIEGGDHVTDHYGCIWDKEGDVLEINLDLEKRTLAFKLNEKDYGVAFSNIKQTSYRLALTLYRCKEGKFALL